MPSPMMRRLAPAVPVVLGALGAIVAPAAAQTCEWSALGAGLGANPGFGKQVFALYTYDDGGGPALYVGGNFGLAGGVPADSIARWDGRSWSAVGTGIQSNSVTAFAAFEGDLYVGGWFTSVGGMPGTGAIVRWDGQGWSSVGGGLDGCCPAHIDALAVVDGALYAGGLFESAGGAPASHIAAWDGQSWSALAGGMNGNVWALAEFEGALYAGGLFTIAGGVRAEYVARWDGQLGEWSPVGFVGSPVTALAVFDGALHAGGGLFGNEGFIAKWNGQFWSPTFVSAPPLGGTRVESLAVFDDGSGPALYVGGAFTVDAGGTQANNIAGWNGASWSALGTGVDDTVFGLAVFDGGGGPALHAGGNLNSAGGKPASSIARWGCPPSCYADCDGNSALNIDDFLCFQLKFALNDPYADCDSSQVLNIDDFLCFQLAFALGC